MAANSDEPGTDAPTVLVAGIGNLFFSDDGFGPEVVRRLAAEGGDLPPRVTVVDYGIRGMHLAYDLSGYDVLVLVDALPGDGPPGQLTLLDVSESDFGAGDFDPHGMAPLAVLASVRELGTSMPPTYVVGCRPATLEEGIGLSDAVAAAVPTAMRQVRALLSERLAA